MLEYYCHDVLLGSSAFGYKAWNLINHHTTNCKAKLARGIVSTELITMNSVFSEKNSIQNHEHTQIPVMPYYSRFGYIRRVFHYKSLPKLRLMYLKRL